MRDVCISKIVIICVYFGKLPDYVLLWMASAKKNSSIDFILINDMPEINHPENVRYVRMSLGEFSSLASEKLGLQIALNSAYKCCDFKPAYGLILEDLIKEYDFWGHCDLDLIWGNLRTFITEDLLQKYDRIYPLGHLSLYRNDPQINRAFMLGGSEKGSYDQVFQREEHCAFDELRGVYLIFKKNNIPQYSEYPFADISPVFKQMKTVTNYTNYSGNYPHQVFIYDRGRILRRAIDETKRLQDKEYAYLHFQKRRYDINQIQTDGTGTYMITPDGFFDINLSDIDAKAVKRYNPYRGKFYEKLEWKKRNLHLRRH